MQTTSRRESLGSVLVVDDDDDLRRVVVVALRASFVVHEASDGADALRVLDSIPTPDVVVCDVMMPRLDGLGFSRQMRARPATAKTPIIFLTAKADPLSVVAGINAGARHYVTKPFKVHDIVDRVTRTVAARR